jgi:hypothetical protein
LKRKIYMNKTNLIPVLISWVICLVLTATLPLRSKLMLGKAGFCLIPSKRRSVLDKIPAFACCMILAGIILIRNLGLFMNAVVCATAVLGCEITCRDYILSKYGGLYEHGILEDNRYISLSDIISIPMVTWEASSAAAEKTNLTIVTSSGNTTIKFSSAKELKTITDKIVELKPALKN